MMSLMDLRVVSIGVYIDVPMCMNTFGYLLLWPQAGSVLGRGGRIVKSIRVRHSSNFGIILPYGAVCVPVTLLCLRFKYLYWLNMQEETGARVRVCDEMEQAVERVIIVSSRSSSYMSNEAQAQVERAVILVHRAIANPMPDDGSERLHAHAPHASADAVLEQRMLVNQSSTGMQLQSS